MGVSERNDIDSGGATSAAGQPVYTIGHGALEIELLISRLQRWGVDLLVDVRSAPYSRRHPQHSRPALSSSVSAVGIEYLFLGKHLGGRPQDPDARTDGRVDYRKIARLPAFLAGIERVLTERECGRRLALLCAEASPLGCHRALLVAPAVAARGAPVLHILASGDIQPHELLLQRQPGQQERLFPGF